MVTKLYHKELRNQKNAYFCDGEVKIDYINETGHFTVTDEVTAKALLSTHPEDIFAEGQKGYEAPIVKPKDETSILYATELKMHIEQLEKEKADLVAANEKLNEKNAQLNAALEDSHKENDLLKKAITHLEEGIDKKNSSASSAGQNSEEPPLNPKKGKKE